MFGPSLKKTKPKRITDIVEERNALVLSRKQLKSFLEHVKAKQFPFMNLNAAEVWIEA